MYLELSQRWSCHSSTQTEWFFFADEEILISRILMVLPCLSQSRTRQPPLLQLSQDEEGDLGFEEARNQPEVEVGLHHPEAVAAIVTVR